MSTKYIASNWRLPNEENSGKSDNYGLSFDGTEYINIPYNSIFNQSVYSFSFLLGNNANSGISNDGIITADSSNRG